jgi:transposase-like protein
MSAVSQHIPCKYCGSSDAGSIYENDDGVQWFKCFSCGTNRKHRDGTGEEKAKVKESKPLSRLSEYSEATSTAHRGIKVDTFNKYAVRSNNDHVFFPYFNEDSVVGFKVRKTSEKVFFSDGNINQGG